MHQTSNPLQKTHSIRNWMKKHNPKGNSPENFPRNSLIPPSNLPSANLWHYRIGLPRSATSTKDWCARLLSAEKGLLIANALISGRQSESSLPGNEFFTAGNRTLTKERATRYGARCDARGLGINWVNDAFVCRVSYIRLLFICVCVILKIYGRYFSGFIGKSSRFPQRKVRRKLVERCYLNIAVNSKIFYVEVLI